ncbi:hypothetical protein [Carboxylicivirga marina]|uniref:hypothetical protein n=1 Tax=Carboxylicivirga marina TaxID=2800988 RepID=UPI002593982C|nr:hypothetical protein [uncultured Carboxylicivirga sp.]
MKVRFLNSLLLLVVATVIVGCAHSRTVGNQPNAAEVIHAVSDLSHEFSFYADQRFHKQYLPNHKGVTNWCNLYNFDFSNANLLLLFDCNERIGYKQKDVEVINEFLSDGGGVVIFGTKEGQAQNQLLESFGATFSNMSEGALTVSDRIASNKIEGHVQSTLEFSQPKKWEVLIADENNKAAMALKKVGKGNLLVASRGLAGSHPSARDSINKELWRMLLPEIAGAKAVDSNKTFKGSGIDKLEYLDDYGTFKLSYNDYLKPYAEAMVDVYKRSFPHIEKRMGVPLSPGMASHITLLATGGGGFSSGKVVALAVWWGGFPKKEDGMIEFLTHESVHSWVLPYPEVWNEPIATYVGNLVMMDMGHEEEAKRRIKKTIERGLKYDPTMEIYDINGHSNSSDNELDNAAKNNIHWGKTYWIFEQLRKENPDIIADYFKKKRFYTANNKINQYDMNNTVAVLSMAIGRDLFGWCNQYGLSVDKHKAEIKMEL